MSKKITGDNRFKLQYQREMNEIHAPEELKQKVKSAVKQQEEKEVFHKTYVRWAVAVVVVIATAVVCMMLYGNQIEDKNSNNTPIHLGTEGVEDVEYIKKETSATEIDGLVISVTDKTQEDILGEETENVTVCDMPVVLSVNIISGYYQCFFEDGEQNYIITSKMTDKEEFLEKLEVLFDAKR